MRLVIKIVLLFLSVFHLITAQENRVGKVEWTQKGPIIYSKGLKSINPQMPMAVQRPAVIESAKISAVINALELIKDINIDSDNTVEKSSAYIKNRDNLIELLTVYKVGDPVFKNDGTVEIDMKLALFENREFVESIMKLKKEEEQIHNGDNDVKDEYSGLIIDCRGSEIMPTLKLNVMSEQKDIVYSSAIASDEAIYKMGGMCQYVKSVEEAKKISQIIGSKPYIIKLKKAEGVADVMLNDSDVKVILGNKNNRMLLKECRVIIVTNNM